MVKRPRGVEDVRVITDVTPPLPPSPDAERARLAQADSGEQDWRAWGPYLSERAWGTVREDYSEHGTAWDYFPHDHARSRAYRWSEDGMAGVCDDRQTFCFALALWNGRDPILKERMFGLGGDGGNHGEDAKDYWWYEDSTPTHSWMRWRYHYPQAAFPYDELVAENALRGRDDTEYELVDTGIFDDDRYWAVTVDYAKAGPTDLCVLITVANRGDRAERLHVLPTLWFRNTWAWGLPGSDRVPTLVGTDSRLIGEHRVLGQLVLAGDGDPTPLLCDNESNAERLWGLTSRSRYPKDGINDHVVDGADSVNPDRTGTKGALHYVLDVPAGGQRQIRLRLTRTAPPPAGAPTPALDLGADLDAVLRQRRFEADRFFADVIPAAASEDEALVARQAIAGLMWGKQFYHFDVKRWLDGDPGGTPPPAGRRHGRNSAWWHMNSFDVISMPDPWEYPWYAAWDLAFHCVSIARVDPGFAKDQLLLLLREWYLHPNGQIPAYEWAFGDVNPPVHAWAALKVFEIDGSRDHEFLARVLHKLLLNFTWWVNRKDTRGSNVFEGGFLGLDNVGPFDRSAALPVAGVLEQSDGTGWMAMYALNLLDMAIVLAERDRAYVDVATKFFEHFAYIAAAAYDQGLWDDEDAFFYDVLLQADGTKVPLKVRSVVGLLPLAATTRLTARTLRRLPELHARLRWFLTNRPEYADVLGARRIGPDGGQQRLLSMVGPEQVVRLLARMLDPDEFLSEYGLRTLSRAHLDEPFSVTLGGQEFSVGYEPAESTSGLFGGNSNWRGPIWMPTNFLLISALRDYAAFFGDDLQVEYPTGSGVKHTLDEIADDLSARLIALFTRDGWGRRPIYGACQLFQSHPDWRDLIAFPEYFHGDNGAGLGAWHQTGWTALVADLILTLRR
ncbi:Glycosyl hydrolase family 63 C-terminal domain-containing protein [Micromonospora pallida]|uniref:Glycosyl hydrolase family 63 C-terminal domain-containing protein n=1 Tax=Micromonospora pallida TaxID=145854 RepID=A0A1C6RRT2_9ACTN|nr:Glycosyl hydrolase family 63 C-terminal domain-containing protein [Micromonospora pallida]